jgi:hypothetical protein
MDATLGQQRIGEQRFSSGIEYEKQLLRLTRAIQDRLISGLPSNYSRDRNTNLAEFFRMAAKEFARLQISSSDVSDDKYHADTRTEYLWQILGDTLFLGDRAINENVTDVKYREFLLRVRNAYYGGSRPANIQAAVSDIVGLPVTLKELYLEARKEGSSYGLKDTHRMFFEILMDGVDSTSSIGLILEDLKFFIDILKPAHVQYDTRLIWTDEARIREQDCTPSYDMAVSPDVSYGADRIHMVTWLLSSLYLYSGTDPDETWETGVVASVDLDKQIVYTVDDRLLVYTASTLFYRRTGSTDEAITPDILAPWDDIRYYAVKDSASSSDVIDTEWGYTGTISWVDESTEVVYLDSGAAISYGDGILAYTRDGAGEYRIDISDLLPGMDIAFRGTMYDHTQFKFYQTPTQVLANPSKQFDSEVIARPFFQENVVKNLEYPPGMTAGPNLVVVDGVATVVEYDPRFYAREGDTKYRERKIDRYSLSIDGTYQTQFSVNDPDRTLTKNESKTIFTDVYGYTGINDPAVQYAISVTHTGDLVEDGAAAKVAAIGDETQTCERAATCQVVPFYEDLRKYWTWPDLQLVSGFFVVMMDFPDIPDVPGAHDIPAWFRISSDPDVYRMPSLPMLGPGGLPATAADVVVYVNGLKVDDAIAYIDPWAGIIGLNFIPPFDVTLRIDYWYSARYPAVQSHLVSIVSPSHPLPGDLVSMMTVISTTGIVKRLYWPFEVTDPDLYGDDRDYQVNKFPILNERGELATPEDITVSIGAPIVYGTTVVSSYIDGDTVLDSMGVDWSGVAVGDIIVLESDNYLDRMMMYTVQSVDALAGTLVIPGTLPPLSTSYPYQIIRFIEVEGAVTDVRPLLGHIRVNFIAPTGVVLKFDYHYTSERREYLMVPDAVCNGLTGSDYYGSSQYTSDTYYGPRYGYGMLEDGAFTGPEIPVRQFDELIEYGYRYRAFDLTASAVLNSETLLLNGYTVPSERGSFKGNLSNLNQARVAFSPEYLTDTGKNIVLNDPYLHNGLEPYTKLNPGVPLFIESQTDDGHYRLFSTADEHPSYDPDYEGGHDVQAGFTIINPDDAGIIDLNGVCDLAENGRATIYSDLKMVRTDNGGYDAPLSTLSDSSNGLPLKSTMVERYYPNREQRINDYLDYINQVPSEYSTGTLVFLYDSDIVKSRVSNLFGMRKGDALLVKDVPYVFNQTSQEWETDIKDIEYIVIEIIDAETIRLNTPFDGPKGDYNYELTRSFVYNVDVFLNEVVRFLNFGSTGLLGTTGFDYGITGTGGLTGVYFSDPDPDPYPRNPDNPNIRHPSAYYYPIGDVVVDGVTYRTNRTLGVTGDVLTSDIIDADGDSYGFTGPFGSGLSSYYETGAYGVTGPFYTGTEGGNSGFTGPSGALNLGITGPVEYANPRTVEEYDVYHVPGGYTGDFFSYSEAEYRVQWRNWDQGVIIASIVEAGETGTLAGLTGVVVIQI